MTTDNKESSVIVCPACDGLKDSSVKKPCKKCKGSGKITIDRAHSELITD